MPITKATPNVISPISTTNLANSIVLRDASGNFSAGTITAALSGNASSATTATSATSATTATTAGSCTGNSATATKLQTARTIALTGSVTGSASFDGSTNISIATTGGGGATSAKAWANFDAATIPGTIRSSNNVSSVTKNGTGDYTVNFTTAMANANYAVVGTADTLTTPSGNIPVDVFTMDASTPRTINSFRIGTISISGGAFFLDNRQMQVVVFGN